MQNITGYNILNKSKRAGVVLMLFFFFVSPAYVFAADGDVPAVSPELPTGWQVEAGALTVETPNVDTMNFHVSNNTAVNFDTFNIGLGKTVNVFQPSDVSKALFRVTGPSLSEIAGTLTANGILYLVNPNGIHFAPTANVQVNALVASTLDITTQNFLESSYIFQHSEGDPYAFILNEGRITGNNIALLGSSVHNDGIIRAVAGTVNLASGDKITVSFDARQMIQVEINEETSGMVVDADGNTLKDAISNSGTIEASQVFLTARVARDIFERAVNQTGVIKAISINEHDGVIRILSDKSVRLAGLLQATGGFIDITTKDFVEVTGAFQTKGTTHIEAYGDIQIRADFTNVSGDLFLIADSDLDGIGAFKQAAGTFVATVESGDITIQSSGDGTLANIDSAGDLVLKQGGAPAVFTQQPDSKIVTKGSMVIGTGVTVEGSNADYEVGENWVNQGVFIPQESTVSLVSPLPAFVLGNNTFNNFVIIEPGKIVKFDTEGTQTIVGTLTVRGAYGNLISLGSIEPPKQWRLNPKGSVDVMFAYLGDCINIRGPPIVARASDSSGNLTNWVVNVLWTGNGSSNNWSDANNWDTGTVPVSSSNVLLNGVAGLNPNKDSVVDSAFQGALDSLTVDGYTGTLCLERSLTLTGDVTLKSGTLDASDQTITAGGDISVANGVSVIGADYAFYARTINIGGVLRASDRIRLISQEKTTLGAGASIVVPSGYVLLKTENGDTTLEDGSLIDVSAKEAGIGGRVEVLGTQVILIGATIDASGVSGGGTVLIGGDFQGKGTVPNSMNTYIGRDSYIYADATGFGNGGRVIVWSEESTSYYGHISVRGGSEGGDGGFVQVSGAQYIEFNGFIDAAAPSGELGTFIMDPAGTSGYAASLATDLLDYHPGETATILGSGWQAGETISLILHPKEDALQDITLTVVADENGNFSDSSFILQEAHRGVSFTLAGTGQSSGSVAETAFTDATFTIIVDTNWSAIAGGPPTSADAIIVKNNATLTVDVTNAVSASIQLGISGGAQNGEGTLSFSAAGSQVTVSGTVTLGNGPKDGSIDMTNGGTLKVGGAITITSLGTWTAGTGTVEYNAAGAQTVTNGLGAYNNLTLSGSGAKTTTGVTVNGILSMEGTATASGAPTYGAAATLQYAGAAVQTTGAELTATIPNLTVNNANGVILSISPTVTGAVTMTSGKFLVTVTANAGQTKVYGNADPALTYALTSGNLVSGDSFSGALSRVAGETVAGSPYAITQGTLAAGSNYTITFFADTFSITAKPLTVSGVTANNKVYDGNITAALNTGGAALVGVVVGDNVNLNTGSAAGTFADKNAGFVKLVTVSGLTISGPDSGNYSLTQPTPTADITAKALTAVGLTGTVTKVYDGNANVTNLTSGNYTITGFIAGEGATIGVTTGTYDNGKDVSANPAGSSVTSSVLAAGDYTANVGTDLGNYDLSAVTGVSATGNIGEITAKALTAVGLTGTVTKVYDGNANVTNLTSGNYTITGFIAGEGATIGVTTGTYDNGKDVSANPAGSSVTSSVLAAGDYTANVGTDLGNYDLSAVTGVSATGNIGEITAYGVTVTVNAGQEKIYGDADPVFTYADTGLLGGDSFSGALSRVAGETVAGSPYAINQGTLTAGGNYTITYVGNTFSITAKPLTVSGVTANNKVYDGNTTAALNTGGAALVGVESGDNVNLNTGTAAGAFADKNFGPGKTVTVSGLKITGPDKGNYTLTQPTTTADIDTRPVNLTGNRTYDGTTSLVAGIFTIGNLVGSETLMLSGSGSMVDKNFGINKPVTLGTLTLGDGGGGGLASNYTLTGGTHVATISKASLTINAVTDTKVYDAGVTSVVVPTVLGIILPDTVTGLTQVFGSKNVLGAGGSTLSVTGYTVNDGNSGKNYSVTTNTASGTITVASLTINAVTDTKVYDGGVTSSGVPTVAGLLGSDTVTGRTQAFDSKNVLGAGGSTLSVTGYTVNDGNSGKNYSVTTNTASGTITVASLTINAVTDTKVYDGGVTSSGVPTVAGLLGSDTVTGRTQAFDSKNVLGAGGSTLSVTGYTVNDGNSGKNYSVTPNTASGTITVASLTINAVTNTKTYDGTTSAAAVPTVAGLQTGDTVTGLTETYDNPTVGTGKTLSVVAYTVNDGNSGNNYSVTLVADTTGVITSAPPAPSPAEPSPNPPSPQPGEDPSIRPPEFHPPKPSGLPVISVIPVFTGVGPVIMPVVQVLPNGNFLLVNPRIPADFGEVTGTTQFPKALTREDFGAVEGGVQFPKALTREDFGAVTARTEFRQPLTRDDFGDSSGGTFIPRSVIFERATGGVRFSSEE